LATIDMGRKLGRRLERGSCVPINNVVWAEAYLRTKWYLDPCSRLAATDVGGKLGGSESDLFLRRGSGVPI